ncbi:hypothetical protein [Bordetella bronchiseptica]|uniref:hypothetical protein n=1 Tax=Bordetella bronchiseptica TaxID=518 RepID=UPI0004598323|nr:hypothetical protein [Bordetella bronchiseptica]KAK50479.1 hypothetical protein L576_1717 [Bordetella bronchiseptica OSU054]
MRTMTAPRPAARGPAPIHKAQSTASKLADLIAPRDLAGKGNWSNDADIPWWAWPASLALAAVFLFGPEMLGWMLRSIL